MKKGRKSFSIKVALKLWCQHVINLLPYVLCAIAIGSLCHLAFRNAPEINFGSIHKKVVASTQWNIAKSPDSRREYLESSSSSDALADYVDMESSVKEQPVEVKETWKEHGLLNLTDFRYIMNNKSLCKQDPKAPKDTRIVPVLIHTSRGQFSQREAVRKSWGSIPIYKKLDVRLIFLLGDAKTKQVIVEEDNESSADYTHSESEDEEEQKKLQDEYEKYGDLLVGSFIEDGKNLTYKHMMGYKWVLNFCSEAAFVMKADIDKFVDIIRWLDWRSKDLEILEKTKNNKKESKEDDDYVTDEEVNSVPDLYCDVFSNGSPVRDEASSYYASPEDWPQEVFPDYCSSWAYGTTIDVMKKQYAVSSERKFFWIDDVYFGALLDLAKKKFNWEPKIEDCFKTPMGKPDKYRDICEDNGQEHFEKTKEFGPVAHVIQGDNFARDMMCLWKKTLHDSDYKFD